MAERSFKKEVASLRLGAGEVFHGEGILAVTKALLQSGLERMDLVSRDDFDLQVAVLERTREKLQQLEERLAELEKRTSN